MFEYTSGQSVISQTDTKAVVAVHLVSCTRVGEVEANVLFVVFSRIQHVYIRRDGRVDHPIPNQSWDQTKFTNLRDRPTFLPSCRHRSQ
jgi:hypothetical protein